jgi:hypothetical protein
VESEWGMGGERVESRLGETSYWVGFKECDKLPKFLVVSKFLSLRGAACTTTRLIRV